jgi:hypothetical protein
MRRGTPLFLLLGACAIENTFEPKRWTDTFLQAPNDQVDILFVVDDSHSMAEEQEALAAGFQSFITAIEDAGSDFHIGVISTSAEADDPRRGLLIGSPPVLTPADDYVHLFEDRIRVGVGGSDHEKGLEAAAVALSPEFLVLHNTGFVRPEANLVIVIVSDEDDCSDDGVLDGMAADVCYSNREYLVPVHQLVDRIHDSKNTGELVQIAGILGPIDDSCADAYTGWRYIEAVRYTGGFLGKICDQDWSEMLGTVGLNALGILTTFQLSYGADVTTLEVFVDEVLVPQDPVDGWTYDWQYWTLTFNGSSVPERDSALRVEYVIAAGAVPPGA